MPCATLQRADKMAGVGGLAHELGHAFELGHPPGCDEGLPQTAKFTYNDGSFSSEAVNSVCDVYALMWLGFHWDYPETYLTDADKEVLNASPFLKHYIGDGQ